MGLFNVGKIYFYFMNKKKYITNNITGDIMVKIILLVIFFLLFIIFFVPWSICFNVNITCDRFFLDINKINGMKNKVSVELCSLLPVFSKKLFEKNNKKKKKGKENLFKKVVTSKKTILKLLSKSYFEETSLLLGFNLGDPVNNSYVNASLNSIICILINSNEKKFNFKKLYYQTFISENLLKLNFNCIIKISLENTIRVILKEYFKMLKKEKRKNLAFKERRIYGRASN